MKKHKFIINICKQNFMIISGLAIGIVISISTVHSINLNSNMVTYDNSSSGLSSNYVSSALDELYVEHFAQTTVTASSQILSGKKAYGRSKLTGTITNYGTSTGQSCTKANTNNKLYIKPANNGYYTTNSSFNTGINYRVYGASIAAKTSGTNVKSSSTGVSVSGSNLILNNGAGITIPAGYYDNAYTVSNGTKIKIGSFTWGPSRVTVNVGFQPVYLYVMLSTLNTSITYDTRVSTTQFYYHGSGTKSSLKNLSTSTSYYLYSINSNGFTINKSGSASYTGHYVALGNLS